MWSWHNSDLCSRSRKLGLQGTLSLNCRKALFAGKIMVLEGLSLLRRQRARHVTFYNLLTLELGTLHQLTVSVFSGL